MTRSVFSFSALALHLLLCYTPAQAAVIRYSDIRFDFSATAVVDGVGNTGSFVDRVEFFGASTSVTPFSLTAAGFGATNRVDGSFNIATDDQFFIDTSFSSFVPASSTARTLNLFSTLLLVDFTIESDRDEKVGVTYSYFSEMTDSPFSIGGAFQLLPRSWRMGAGNNLVTANYDPNISESSSNFILDTNTTYALVMNWDWDFRSSPSDPETVNNGFRFGHGIALSSVPESSTSALILLGAVLLVRRRSLAG